jgi:squalene synthase HpnC
MHCLPNRALAYIVCERLTVSSTRATSASFISPANPAAEARLTAALAPVQGDPDSEAEQAQEYTRGLTRGHYENFSVVSLLLPRGLRQDFCNVYAFCRIADDMADELGDRQRAAAALGSLREQTEACYAGRVNTRLFAALGVTIRRHEIPMQPFLDLIDAFEQDQRVDRYQTFDQLVDYCRRSADPVGRLVLYMCGHRDAERQRLSDQICTALQLANFWQDVRRDMLERNRIYLPQDSMLQFGVTEQQILEGRCDDGFRKLMQAQVERTQRLFNAGRSLLPMLDGRVRRHIALFGKGGEAILQAIRQEEYDTLTHRPTLSRWQKARLMLSAAGAGLAGALHRGAAA